MSQVTVRELRNHGGDVLDRVERGERFTITRAGRPVAELRPLPRPRVTREALIEHSRHLAYVDPDQLRAELDEVIDSRLFNA